MYIKSLVSGVDTCFWQGGCSKLNLGTPIFFFVYRRGTGPTHFIFVFSI